MIDGYGDECTNSKESHFDCRVVWVVDVYFVVKNDGSTSRSNDLLPKYQGS